MQLASRKASDPSGSSNLQSPVPPPHRQGGLWNFLTWSFFLSQVLAAESFMGSPARAEAEAESAHGAADSSIAQPPGAPGQPFLAAHINQPDDASTTTYTTSDPLQAAHLHALGDISPPLNVALGTHDWSVGHGVGSSPSVGALDLNGEDQAARQSGNPFESAAPIVEPAIFPAIGTIGDTVDQVVSPILGTVGNVVGSLDAILDHALAPIVAQVVAPIVGVADHILQPLDAMIGEGVATVAPNIELLLAPVQQTADAILQPVATVVDQVVAPLSDVLGTQGVLASPGNIVLSELPLASSLHPDDLYSKGSYTAYNLSLGAEPSPASAPLHNGGSVVSIIENIIGHQHDADTTHEGHDNTIALHSLQTSALDELHLRGSSEGLSL
jgi:hypothetical protein